MITLRHLSTTDLEPIKAYVCDTNVSKYLTWAAYTNESDIAKYLTLASAKSSYPDEYLGAIWSERLIGTVHIISRGDGNAQTAFGLIPQLWNKGIGSGLAIELAEYIRRTEWAVHTRSIWVDIHRDNVAAIKIAVKMGFHFKSSVAPNRDRYIHHITPSS